MSHLLNVLRGFLMGSADVVPGVSGGTIALVLGIYERLVHAIRTGAGALASAVRGRFAEAWERAKSVEWSLLIPLLAGIGLAILSLAAAIEHFLEEEPTNTAAVFFGLVAGSILVAWPLVKEWTPTRIGTAVAVGVAAFVLLGLRSEEITDPSLAFFFGAGSIAIVAMILPGISGSFILLMLGMYEAVIGAVNDRDFAVLLVFMVGAVIGLALFSTILDRALRDHHDTVIAALTPGAVALARRHRHGNVGRPHRAADADPAGAGRLRGRHRDRVVQPHQAGGARLTLLAPAGQ
jgi:putative membrane protein